MKTSVVLVVEDFGKSIPHAARPMLTNAAYDALEKLGEDRKHITLIQIELWSQVGDICQYKITMEVIDPRARSKEPYRTQFQIDTPTAEGVTFEILRRFADFAREEADQLAHQRTEWVRIKGNVQALALQYAPRVQPKAPSHAIKIEPQAANY